MTNILTAVQLWKYVAENASFSFECLQRDRN